MLHIQFATFSELSELTLAKTSLSGSDIPPTARRGPACVAPFEPRPLPREGLEGSSVSAIAWITTAIVICPRASFQSPRWCFSVLACLATLANSFTSTTSSR